MFCYWFEGPETAEIRVAAGNPIGLSEFTDVIFSNSPVEVEENDIHPRARKQAPAQVTNESTTGPTVLPTPTGLRIGFVTQITADIEWDPPATIPSGSFSYRFRFLLESKTVRQTISQKASISQTCLCLVGLVSNTIYTVEMFIESRHGTLSGPLSQPIQFKTTLPAKIVHFSKWTILSRRK